MKQDRYLIDSSTMFDVQLLIDEILDFVDKCGQPDEDGFVTILFRNNEEAGNDYCLTQGEISNLRKFANLKRENPNKDE